MASYSDPKLLSLPKNIALSVARIEQLLAALMRDDATLTWEQLVQARAGFYKAQATKNVGASKAALDAIMLLIDQGAADVDKWAELRREQEHLRKMIETEWKSKTALARVLTMEQFANFLEAFKSAIPLGRLGQGDDLASAIAFFASDDAGFVTGQVLSVSGGLTMHG